MNQDFVKFVDASLTAAPSGEKELLEKIYGADIPVVCLAILCHELNKVICELSGDFSQVAWQDAEKWQQESALKGVQFALDNPHATPKDQHESWCTDKIDHGWTYGPEKCAEKKTHPCLVPYEELPWVQKLKDKVFQTVVHAAQN